MRRAFSMFSAVSTSAVSPQATGSRASSSVSGKFALHHIEVVQRRQHGALLAVPAPHQIQQIGGGLGVDRVERLVEHDHARVLQQQAREQHALHLAARQRADRPLLEAGEADRRERLLDRVAHLAADAAEQAGAAPQPHRHHVVDVDRKAAVDLGDLRQIGDVLRLQPPRVDRAGERLEHPDHALEQRRLAGAVRPDHRHQRAGCDRAVEMMHGRMAVVAERQIAKLQRSPTSRHRPEYDSPERGDQNRRARQAAATPPSAGSTARSQPADASARVVVIEVMNVGRHSNLL